MRAEEFDQKFDDGEDVTSDLDLAATRRPGRGSGLIPRRQ
jgi:hypothetical protein